MLIHKSGLFTYIVVFGLLLFNSVLKTSCSSDFVGCRLSQRPLFPPFLDDMRKECCRNGLVHLRVNQGSKLSLEPVSLLFCCPFWCIIIFNGNEAEVRQFGDECGGCSRWVSDLMCSALKSSLKTAKRLQLDQTKTAMDWTCSLGLSVLRLEDRKKTGCGGPVLSVETGLLYPYNYTSKHI